MSREESLVLGHARGILLCIPGIHRRGKGQWKHRKGRKEGSPFPAGGPVSLVAYCHGTALGLQLPYLRRSSWYLVCGYMSCASRERGYMGGAGTGHLLGSRHVGLQAKYRDPSVLGHTPGVFVILILVCLFAFHLKGDWRVEERTTLNKRMNCC